MEGDLPRIPAGYVRHGRGRSTPESRDGAVVELDLRPPALDRSDTDLGFQDSGVVAEFLLRIIGG